MSAAPRRGACPSLAAPMLTGDGWLARLSVGELTAGQLAGLAAAAERLGNGLVEVTARGSLQLRGLTAASAAELAGALDGLGIVAAEGLPVVTGPLAGLDPEELADPRPLAAALRAGAAGLGLLPKVSVVVDGGGALHLDAVPADVRLVATRAPGGAAALLREGPPSSGRWLLAVGGAAGVARPVGVHDAEGAARAALGVLELLAARRARARDLLDEIALGADDLPARQPVDPIGRLAVGRGLGLPFGQADAAMLAALAALAATAGAARFRPAPGRALLVIGAGDDAALVDAAARLGFVVAADDPRRAIVACSGAPACASATLPTRRLAAAIAAMRPEAAGKGWRLHLSGCGKRCAQPVGPAVTLVGRARGWDMTGEGMAVPQGLAKRLEAIVGRMGP